MDDKTLKKANEFNAEINRIKNFIENMDSSRDHFSYTIYAQYRLPQELKDLIRPILKEYQEKLFCQLKNL